MTIARALAQRIVNTRYEDLPEDAVYWCRIAYLDTIGVALAGAMEEAPRMVADVVDASGATGPSLVLGTDRRTDCLNAALINGTAAHALDFDNGSNTMGGTCRRRWCPRCSPQATHSAAAGATSCWRTRSVSKRARASGVA